MKIPKSIKSLRLQFKSVFPPIVAVTKSRGLQALIALVAILIAGLFTQQQFEGIRTNQTEMRDVAGVATAPTPTSIPTPTNTPIPAREVQEVTTPKYDGTRTGRIIKYIKWCSKSENEEIQIYENELLAGKAADGKTYYMIQSDWECYARYLAGPPQTGNQQNTTNSQNKSAPQSNPTNLPYPTLPPLIDCYVYSPCTGQSNTYRVNQDICDYFHRSTNSSCDYLNSLKKLEEISNRRLELTPVQINFPTPVPLKIIQEPTPTCYPVMFPNGAWGFSCGN